MTICQTILKTVVSLCLAAGGGWTAHAQTVIPVGGTMTVPGIALDLACTDLLVQGTLIVGSAQINQSATVGIASGANSMPDKAPSTSVATGTTAVPLWQEPAQLS